MKTLFNYVVYGVTVGIGYMAGVWLWDEILEDKANDLKERLGK